MVNGFRMISVLSVLIWKSLIIIISWKKEKIKLVITFHQR